ncbi:MAG: hypothetical protein CML13_15370 [Puniceicoccaceae bacterium]|nr:hypothetical protein [Puniceicoccaceae bacterium]
MEDSKISAAKTDATKTEVRISDASPKQLDALLSRIPGTVRDALQPVLTVKDRVNFFVVTIECAPMDSQNQSALIEELKMPEMARAAFIHDGIVHQVLTLKMAQTLADWVNHLEQRSLDFQVAYIATSDFKPNFDLSKATVSPERKLSFERGTPHNQWPVDEPHNPDDPLGLLQTLWTLKPPPGTLGSSQEDWLHTLPSKLLRLCTHWFYDFRPLSITPDWTLFLNYIETVTKGEALECMVALAEDYGQVLELDSDNVQYTLSEAATCEVIDSFKSLSHMIDCHFEEILQPHEVYVGD